MLTELIRKPPRLQQIFQRKQDYNNKNFKSLLLILLHLQPKGSLTTYKRSMS